MNKNNRDLDEQYFLTGMWIEDNPVNEINYWCSKCKKSLGNADTISFTVSKLLWKPFRFEYHKKCVKEALEHRDLNAQHFEP